jgi:Co/Zn/Cd efflux system component
MSASCCSPSAELIRRRRRVLWTVLGVNASMFAVELIAGLIAGSVALQADSLDMLGDALVYGFSLWVVAGTEIARARTAQLKGLIMLGFGLGIALQLARKVVNGAPPDAAMMGGIGLLALAANAICLALLWQHRSDDMNMRSTWICSRNDILANVGVLVAALGVRAVGAAWPDVAVSLAIVALFLWSAGDVLRNASKSLRNARHTLHALCTQGVCPSNACRCPAA